MGSKYVLGKGGTFSVSTNGTTWTPIKQAKTINYTGQKSDYDDVTNMDSPSSFREVAPTLLDPGSAALQGVFDPEDPGQLMLRAAWSAQTLLMCKHQFPLGTDQTTSGLLRTYNAYVSDTPLDSQFDKASTFSVTLKLTGPITDTPGS